MPFPADCPEPDQVNTSRLISQLEHPFAADRKRALNTLVALGEGVVPDLVDALRSDTPQIRAGVLRALAELGSSYAVDPLIDYLTAHPTEIGDNRSFAMQAIARGTSPEVSNPKKLFVFLQTAIQDDDTFVAAYALTALGQLGDPRAAPLLEQGARALDPFVAEKARAALNSLAVAPPPPQQLTEQLLPPQEISFALQSPNAARREMGFNALAQRVQTHNFDPTALLVTLLNGPIAIGQLAAIDAMKRLRDPAFVTPLLDFLERQRGDADLSAHALRALKPFGSHLEAPALADRLMPLLQQRLKHSDMFVRAAAVALLPALPGERPVSLVVSACLDRERWVRDEAAGHLRHFVGAELRPFAKKLALLIETLSERLRNNSAPTEDDKIDASIVERALLALTQAIPARSDHTFTADISDAAFAALGSPSGGVKVAALECLKALITAGNRPSTRSKSHLRALAAALRSKHPARTHLVLDLLEITLPPKCDLATTHLVDILYKGDMTLALKAIPLLGRAGDTEARQVLRSLSDNDSLDIASAAIVALKDAGLTP